MHAAVVEFVVSRGTCTFGSPVVPSVWAIVANKTHMYYTSYTAEKVWVQCKLVILALTLTLGVGLMYLFPYMLQPENSADPFKYVAYAMLTQATVHYSPNIEYMEKADASTDESEWCAKLKHRCALEILQHPLLREYLADPSRPSVSE
jgi:hypothetical protein